MKTAISLWDLHFTLCEDVFYSQSLLMEEITNKQISRIGIDKETQKIVQSLSYVGNQFSWQGYFIRLLFHDEYKRENPSADIDKEISDLKLSNAINSEASSFYFTAWLKEMVAWHSSLMEYFRRYRLPLPSAIFPDELDNTKFVLKKFPKLPPGWNTYFHLEDVQRLVDQLKTCSAETQAVEAPTLVSPSAGLVAAHNYEQGGDTPEADDQTGKTGKPSRTARNQQKALEKANAYWSQDPRMLPAYVAKKY